MNDICLEILNKMTEKRELSPYGIWLKDKRTAKGWSVRTLAEKANNICSSSFISQIENNSYVGKKGIPMKPGIEIVDALSRALGASLNEAREKADYPLLADELSESEVVKEFTYVISKYKNLSPRAKELANKHFSETIDFLLESELLIENEKTDTPKVISPDKVGENKDVVEFKSKKELDNFLNRKTKPKK